MIETKEELEEYLKPKRRKMGKTFVKKYGDDENRVMILALGEKSEYTDALTRIICLTALPMSYEIIRIDGKNIQDILYDVYDAVRQEEVLDETIGYNKKLSFNKTNRVSKVKLKNKLIYIVTYNDIADKVLDAVDNRIDMNISRLYFISPDFKKLNEHKKYEWLTQAEILMSDKDSASKLKQAKRFNDRYMSHMTTMPATPAFGENIDLIAIQKWLSGNREKKYGGNKNILIFLAAGVFLGYIFDAFVLQSQLHISSKIPLGMLGGAIVGALSSELWRRR